MDTEARWYVIHTYSGYENTVADAIIKSAENRKMTDLIQEVNIPLETVTEVVDSAYKTYERKVFPGYVLVKMILTDESWHLVRNVRGATGFVGTGTTPIPLTDSEIQALGVEKKDLRLHFEVGSTICVIDGPLEGFKGKVENIDTDREIVRVTVSMFGRDTPVELEFDQVEPADE